MKTPRQQVLFPDGLSISLAILIGIVISFLANAGYFFDFYGYRASTDLVNQNTHNIIITFLQRIDRFQITDAIVTFLLWSVVGLFILALLQSVVRSYGSIRSNLDFTSSDYVKPQNFSRTSFFEAIIFDILFLILGMAVLVTFVLLFFGLLLPYATDLVRQVAAHSPSVQNFAAAAVGILLTCVGTGIILYVARLVIRRHYFLPS